MSSQNSRSQCLAHIPSACGRGAEQGRRHEEAERQPVPRPCQTGHTSAGLVCTASNDISRSRFIKCWTSLERWH